MRDQFAYTYDHAGNRLTRTNSLYATQNQTYTYDGFQRLKTNDESTAGNDRYWELDQLGNWDKLRNGTTSGGTLLEERTHNTVNELTNFVTPAPNVDPAYDAAGNMTTIPQPKTPTSGYTATYDAWNRLVMLKVSSSTRAAYEYDGLHRRTVRDETISGGDRRHFYYNENWQCLEEYTSIFSGGGLFISDDLTATYVWHPEYIDSLAIRYNSSGIKHYYCHDANFNITAVLDGSGTVVERYAYTPYGEVTVLDANFSVDSDNISDIGNEFLYTGRRLDPETGLQLNRHRYYHQQLGRWINRDPIGYRGGMNLYGYVGGMPTYYVDPWGLMDWPIYVGDDPVTGNPIYHHGSLKTPHWSSPPNGYDLSEPPSGELAAIGFGGLYGALRLGLFGALADEAKDVAVQELTGMPVCPKRPKYDGDMVPAPGRGLGSKAPDQVTPGVRELEGQYVDDLGQVQPYRAHYDEFGRQIERTDFTDLPAGTHPNPHHHIREHDFYKWPPGYNDQTLPGPGPVTGFPPLSFP